MIVQVGYWRCIAVIVSRPLAGMLAPLGTVCSPERRHAVGENG